MIKKLLKYAKEKSPNWLFYQIDYYRRKGRFLNLSNPETFAEKINYIKLNSNLNEMSKYVDKLLVRDFIKEKIGKDCLPNIIQVIPTNGEIDFDTLPEKFVVKYNNGSGMNIIVKDKQLFCEDYVNEEIKKWRKSSFYKNNREFQYKDVNGVVFIEEYLECRNGLKDYKLFCSNGKVFLIQVISNRQDGQSRHNYYSKSWEHLDIYREEFSQGEFEQKPHLLEDMISKAEILSQNFTFVRVDFFIQNGEILFFGELTFTPASGNIEFLPKESDLDIASNIII
ncbi:ATP-grasp fold amidoligase family protein [Vibrio parahaemolyticus]|uniref:ATP-grasp fold amidoligase family protein n=1 Tax=Vibrio parahaemolyticus TaxID=670 RepID=UPI001E614E59|nr:ATP-grasp fold amidoligase family protein [Vibrio parahaemolyticus]HDM8217028.1 hypothetical protein [Vibrio campbellii]